MMDFDDCIRGLLRLANPIVVFMCVFMFALFVSSTMMAAAVASESNSELLHSVALPVIGVAFAAAAFPFQAGALARDHERDALSVVGVAMFIGALMIAMAYGGFWGLETCARLDRSIHEYPGLIQIVQFFKGICVLFGFVGALIWWLGCFAFVLFYRDVLLKRNAGHPKS